jgi:hypothetical protein
LQRTVAATPRGGCSCPRQGCLGRRLWDADKPHQPGHFARRLCRASSSSKKLNRSRPRKRRFYDGRPQDGRGVSWGACASLEMTSTPGRARSSYERCDRTVYLSRCC